MGICGFLRAEFFTRADARARAPAELAHARRHFFSARRYRDPFGNTSLVTFDAHDLTLVATPRPGWQHDVPV